MSKYAPFCRICMEDKGELINPCRCSGSLKHIHQECLKTWLQSMPRNMDQAGCEICNSKFSMKFVVRYKCIPKQIFSDGLSNCLFIPLLSIVIAILSVITYMLIYRIKNGLRNVAQEIYAIFLIIACVLSILFLLILIMLVIKDSCFKETLDNWTIFNQSFHDNKEESIQNFEINIFPEVKEPKGNDTNRDSDDHTLLSRDNTPRIQNINNIRDNS